MKLMRCSIFLLVMIFFTTGCSKRKLPEKIEWLDGHRRSEQEMADACMEQIVNLINSQDIEGLYGLFSDNSRDEADESIYKQGIEALFAYIDGEIKEFKAAQYPYSSSSSMMGLKTLKLGGYYRFSTEQNDYWMYFTFCPRNDRDEVEIGIVRIVTTTDKVEQSEGFSWKYINDPSGIYFISEEDFSSEE